jgi:hypothetical protein
MLEADVGDEDNHVGGSRTVRSRHIAAAREEAVHDEGEYMVMDCAK